MSRGTLYIISAPSGAGKTSLVKELVRTTRHLTVSVSHTTRPPRCGEKEGVNYHFVTPDHFASMVGQSSFLEHATVFEHAHGTSKIWVTEQLNKGLDVILEIDWQGARQIRTQVPDATTIFVLPPSLATLHDRLTARGQDDEQIIAGRMEKAVSEMSHYDEFDYLVINDQFDEALFELSCIIRSRRLSAAFQHQYRRKLLTDLLSGGTAQPKNKKAGQQ